MSAKLSVCVLVCNEEQALGRCLDSVAFADEIVVVVDAASKDGSEKLAFARADIVETRPYAGDIEQKRHCVSLASHDWVMVIDPDEVAEPELGGQLRDRIGRAGDRLSGLQINRVTRHLGRWIRHGDFHPDWKLRVFRRSRARWTGANPHGRVEVNGEVGRVAASLLHYSYDDLADQVDRIQFFSREAAVSMHRAGRRARISDLVLRPPARFLRAYLLKSGWRDGVPGLIIAVATGFHVFLKYAKLWELRHRDEVSEERLKQ
jgi:glycosyltransferase involved in cell wall biosynthesis